MRILLITEESDESFINEFRDYYTVDLAHSDDEGAYLCDINDYDAVVVDDSGKLLKPEICKTVRENLADTFAPIVYVLRDNNFNQNIPLLEAGADVCLHKPVQTQEIRTQLLALLRRKNNGNPEIVISHVHLHVKEQTVIYKRHKLDLRRKEYELLEHLFINKNKIISKEKLLEHIWQDSIYIFSNTVEVHMLNLRKKLKTYGIIDLVKTSRSFGYYVSD
jgi:DNA-binding response OmpR family regulator